MNRNILKSSLGTDSHPLTAHDNYWSRSVRESLAHQDWSQADLREQIDLPAWQGFLDDLPRDPYVNQRWKRMSWLALTPTGDVTNLGECPMAQGGAFNDAESMADKLRYYAPLTEEFLSRPDVKAFVRGWAGLWNLGAGEPILMQITGVRGKGQVDPLQGQGIHADGCKALSIMVVNRENVTGAENHLYRDKAGQHPIAHTTLAPGEVLHLRDDRVFHSVDGIRQLDETRPFERFIIIINSRFVDEFQNRILRRHFPHAILHTEG
ncbi:MULTISPECIES: 2OG-Fe dioxygenase family protein [Halomonas]|uniref:2OG-Fe dioxygenase family protein n=2 Tax=Halomonas TaxID=2745 RepID=A0A7X4VWV4_9GAMM|nr:MULTISPECIES: 2OG-Fe dioxygenase family protein [Halomonas]MDR5903081.1 2OG-Fe dioxygenase family protein [Halomonas icarae]NAW11637.1 hypothetical protein [Halomonas icarae]TDB02924.1 hypothetical protein E0702_07830 [Halomonas marinisediminis]